ncbi:hypothetical protein ACLVWQ_28255 [Streptomyces sp. CWNU-52B]|uniref:hypothetical protein n=1 Tax=unclassified Streptomyces TaxID=2593676 RepID=UPI0039C41636
MTTELASSALVAAIGIAGIVLGFRQAVGAETSQISWATGWEARHGTLRRVTSTDTRDAQLNRLWGAVCAFAGIFFLLWGLSWVNASVLNEDLQNYCEDLHTASFPFEKSCTHADGTVEGANSLLYESFFFGSMAAGVTCLGAVLVLDASRLSLKLSQRRGRQPNP